MKVIVISVQGTHTDAYEASILEFIAVALDTDIEFEPLIFHKRFVPPSNFSASLDAVIVNRSLLSDIQKFQRNEVLDSEHVLYDTPLDALIAKLIIWITSNKLYTTRDNRAGLLIAGKNVNNYASKLMTKNFPTWPSLASHRAIDLGSLLINSDDIDVPNFEKCLKRTDTNLQQFHSKYPHLNLAKAVAMASMIHQTITNK